MKKVFYFIAVACIAGAGLSSCNKEDSNPSDQALETVQTILEIGKWHVALFEDSGNDETHHFSGYEFTFEQNGTLTAENGTTSVQGTWSITDSNSDDDSLEDLDFNIFFNVSNDFEDLNDDWDIISHTDMTIELIDISGGNGGTDYLTFERN